MAAGVYDTGTITLTNGSATVTGSGTSWVGNVSAGQVLITSDGAVYPIEEVVSATEITLSRDFTGSGGSGASYEIVPTGGVAQALTARINTLITSFQSVVDEAGAGKFPNGSLAQPGVRFTADEDTGLHRPAANAISLVAGGVEALRLNSSGVPSGAAVQSSSTDTTADRLLKVGAFGLGKTGQPPYASDLNDTTLPVGVYYTNSSTLNLTGLPSDFGVLTVTRWSGDIIHQRWSRNALTPEIYERVTLGSGWGDWVEVYHTSNILGSVSESGGEPTGAVIERGSNSNGEYVRFADGTQICTNGNSAITSNPAAFVGTVTSVDGDKLRIGRWF